MSKTSKAVNQPVADDSKHLVVATLDRLSLSDLNPRGERGDDDVAALAGSIRTVGLLQNLAGIERGDGRIEIVAGGRRLRALQRIADEDGTDLITVTVPVALAQDEAEARVWASTENTARIDLHPAEEIRAYRQMAESGEPEERIAKAFAVTVRHVRGRLRLANLAEPILDALRAGTITLDVAAAYTVTEDTKAQLMVFESIGPWDAVRPASIKHRLTADSNDGDSKLAVFVGREAYEAAGGVVREDLFGEDIYFTDTELLARLAGEKLDEAANALKEEGWKWVESSLESFDYAVLNTMGRSYVGPVEIPETDADRYDELADLIEDGEASDGELEEFQAVSQRMLTPYTDAQKQHGGVYVCINYHGTLEIMRGLVKPVV